MMKIWSWILGASVALASPAPAEEPITIGVYLPLTGKFGVAGRSIREGVRMAHKLYPQALNRPVELRIADTRSEKEGAAEAVFRLIERERVTVIIGEMVSGNTIAGSFIAERHGIPMVTPSATSPLVSEGKKCVFRTCPTDSEQAALAADLALRNLGARTAAIVCDVSQEYSVGLAACFKSEFSRRGGAIHCEARIRTGDRDFLAQINQIKMARPDIIYAPIYSTECALFARQTREVGLNSTIVAGDAVHVPDLMELGGRSVENLLFTAYFHESLVHTDRGKRLRDLFKKETGRQLQAAQAMGADAYFLVLDAIAEAGSAEPAKIREALASLSSYDGVTGCMSRGQDGKGTRPLVVTTVRDGRFVEWEGELRTVRAGRLSH